MKHELQPRYQIKRTEQFIKETQQLNKNYPRVLDLFKAVDWNLQRGPHEYSNLITNYYLWTTDELSSEEFPVLKIFYMIDDENDTVTLIDVEES